MTEILYAPAPEQVVTTNAWAFLHWLHATCGMELAGWTELQHFSAQRPRDFSDAITAFAQLPDRLRHANTAPRNFARRAEAQMPDLLLHCDLRPDDRLLVVGPPWPWLAAKVLGTSVNLAAPADVMAVAALERATVLAAPASVLANATFRRPGGRPYLAALRAIIATGGPLSPEGRRRIYTWIKPDLTLLARGRDTYWGNPLEPVLARPSATPAFFRPPASGAARP